jgi:uncharacterized membrane protein
MKTSRLPLCVAIFAFALFSVSIATSIPALPDRIATHFNDTGAADGWMSRDTYLMSFSTVALGISFFAPVLTYAIRFFPAAMLSVPRGDYWRSPENYPRACAFLFHHTLWLCALNLFFMGSIHQHIVIANLEPTPTLSTDSLGIGIGVLIGGVIIWIVVLLGFFLKAPRSKG